MPTIITDIITVNAAKCFSGSASQVKRFITRLLLWLVSSSERSCLFFRCRTAWLFGSFAVMLMQCANQCPRAEYTTTTVLPVYNLLNIYWRGDRITKYIIYSMIHLISQHILRPVSLCHTCSWESSLTVHSHHQISGVGLGNNNNNNNSNIF